MFASFNARAVGLPDLGTEPTIAAAAAAGFAGVDLMVRDLVRAGSHLGTVRQRLDDLGLRAGAFPMTFDWRGDEASFRRGLADLPALADAAAQLGLQRTGTWVLPALPVPPHPATEPGDHRKAVSAWHVDRLGAIARILAESEIRLGLEVIGVATARPSASAPFIARLIDLEPELSDLRREPNVGLLVDAFHLYAAEEPVDAALLWGADRIVWAHVADVPPGSILPRAAIQDAERGLPDPIGPVNCRAFLRTLRNSGYDGPVTAEPLAQCEALLGRSPLDVAHLTKAALDACWPTVASPEGC